MSRPGGFHKRQRMVAPKHGHTSQFNWLAIGYQIEHGRAGFSALPTFNNGGYSFHHYPDFFEYRRFVVATMLSGCRQPIDDHASRYFRDISDEYHMRIAKELNSDDKSC